MDESVIVPVEEFMGDLPLAIPLEQREYIGSSGIGSSQLAGPVLNFKMDDGDAFDDLDACEARIDIRCWAVLGDPLENMFNGATIFDSLTVAGDGCGWMKSRPHEIALAHASTRDVAVHGAGDCVVLGEVSVGGGVNQRDPIDFINQDLSGRLGV